MGRVESLKTKEKFKKTEIGEIPVDWELSTIKDVAEKKRYSIVDGTFGSQIKINGYVKKGIPVIEMENISDNKFNESFENFVSEKKYPEVKRSTVHPNDLLISKTGPLGLVARVPENIDRAIITSRLAKITFSKKIDTVFAYFYLLHMNSIGYWASVAHGSTMKILNISLIRRMPIPIPPLQEQRNIAEILTSIDNAIEKSENIIEQSEKLKKGLIKELLTKGIGHKKFKKTKSGKIPASWKIAKMGDIVNISGGTTPSTRKKRYWVGGQILWATPTDITSLGSIYIGDTAKKITESAVNETAIKIQDSGTILMTSREAIGYAAIAKYPITTNQCFINISCSDKIINLYFYYWILFKKKLFKSLAQGSTFLKLSKKTFKKVRMPLPKIKEQRKIVSILKDTDKKIQKEVEKKEALENLKKGLMQRLLTGKIRTV
ncbi:MAG: restriction endonuclease subunit S [Elusimicrobiota bacterium]